MCHSEMPVNVEKSVPNISVMLLYYYCYYVFLLYSILLKICGKINILLVLPGLEVNP